MEGACTSISWVHGDAMIANSLTKTTEKHQMLLYVQMGFRWKIVCDENMRSAKARRKQGQAALESDDPQQHSKHFHLPSPCHHHNNALPRMRVQNPASCVNEISLES